MPETYQRRDDDFVITNRTPRCSNERSRRAAVREDQAPRSYSRRMALILHIALVEEWEAAQRAGSYRMSTRGKGLDDGATFIHASRPDQVSLVANFAYEDVTEPLCLLVIDTERLVSALCDEDLDGAGMSFPHIYGPLNLDAVVDVRPYERDADRRWPDVTA